MYTVKVKISPNSSKNEIIKTDDGVKIKLTAQPIDNKANKALVEFLSKELKIPKTFIEIMRGSVSKDKVLAFYVEDEEKIKLIKEKLR